MELVDYADTEADLALTLALETDPEVMRRDSRAAGSPPVGRFGFTDRGERDVVYAGRTLRCQHWALDL